MRFRARNYPEPPPTVYVGLCAGVIVLTGVLALAAVAGVLVTTGSFYVWALGLLWLGGLVSAGLLGTVDAGRP